MNGDFFLRKLRRLEMGMGMGMGNWEKGWGEARR